MEITHFDIPSAAKDGQKWRRSSWGGLFDPGDAFAPIPIGPKPATVTVTVKEAPAGGKIRFELSPTGRGRWTVLEGGAAAFFKRKPGDTFEWNGLGGFLRPVVETPSHGRVEIVATVMPQAKTRMTGEAVA